MYLRKMISIFYKEHPEKPTATSPLLNIASPMAKLIIKLFAEQKQKRPKNALQSTPSEATRKNPSQFDFPEPKAGR